MKVQPEAAKPKYDLHNLAITMIAVSVLQAFGLNPREHGPKHVAAIMRSIQQFGMIVPILVDENYVIIAGHGTLLACQQLGYSEVPVIVLAHLNEPEKIAFRIAHNRLCETGEWSAERLQANFELLYDHKIDFDYDVTGFATAEIDIMRMGGRSKIREKKAADLLREDVVPLPDEKAVPVSRVGDRFMIGDHVIVCGNTCDTATWQLAMHGQLADLGLTDPPYNCPIPGFVSGGGKLVHENFVEASGEMDRPTFRKFSADAFRQQAAHSKPGAFNMQFTYPHALLDMMLAAEEIYGPLKHMAIWAKTNGGLGGTWRRAWEGILIYQVAGGRSLDNVKLGKHGRNRTDVWTAAGVNTFKPGRMEELTAHPTSKPVPLLREAILDVTPIGGLVIDGFLGSGSTIAAAHEAKRRGIGIELDPKYVDVAVRRIEKLVGKQACHQSGATFDELAAGRANGLEPGQ